MARCLLLAVLALLLAACDPGGLLNHDKKEKKSEPPVRAQPELSMPEVVDFGAPPPGGISTQTVRLENTGNWDLAISAVSFSDATGYWSLTGSAPIGAVGALPFSGTILLIPGKSLDLTFRYLPLTSVAGPYYATLSVTSNSGNIANTLRTVGFIGDVSAGVGPGALIAPATMAFGTVPVGSNTSKYIDLQNAGSGSLIISSIDLMDTTGYWSFVSSTPSGAVSALPFSGGYALGPGVTLTLQLRFEPTSTTGGPFAADLEIVSDTGGVPNTLTTVSLDGDSTMSSGAQTGNTATATELSLAQQVWTLVNSERAANSLPPLSYNPAVAQVAYDHSWDMDYRNFFSHTNPDAAGPGTLRRVPAAAAAAEAEAEARQATLPRPMSSRWRSRCSFW